MYSALPYAIIAQIPYVLIQGFYYSLVIYSMMAFQWTAANFL
ncbi:hypothetical protein DsansV1_C23g0176701 [Dioscorea sansibarensis]